MGLPGFNPSVCPSFQPLSKLSTTGQCQRQRGANDTPRSVCSEHLLSSSLTACFLRFHQVCECTNTAAQQGRVKQSLLHRGSERETQRLPSNAHWPLRTRVPFHVKCWLGVLENAGTGQELTGKVCVVVAAVVWGWGAVY